MRFLYIEDEQSDIDLMSRYFQSMEHDLVTALTVDELWAKLDDSIDIIMIDIFLHGMKSGYTLAHQLRAKGYEQPLVAITALTTPVDASDIEAAGFDVVIHKPFTFAELETALDQFVY